MQHSYNYFNSCLVSIQFPIDAVHERLIEANVSDAVGPQAAVYCSAILQFLTSKVLQSAVKCVQMTEEQNPSTKVPHIRLQIHKSIYFTCSPIERDKEMK